MSKWNLDFKDLPCKVFVLSLNRSAEPWSTIIEICVSVQFSSVAQSCPTLWDPMNRSTPACPSPTPGVHWDSRPSSQWCHPAISSSVLPFSSCPQSLQHQSLFQWVKSSREVAKVTGVSDLASFLPKKSQGWSSSLRICKWNLDIAKPSWLEQWLDSTC